MHVSRLSSCHRWGTYMLASHLLFLPSSMSPATLISVAGGPASGRGRHSLTTELAQRPRSLEANFRRQPIFVLLVGFSNFSSASPKFREANIYPASASPSRFFSGPLVSLSLVTLSIHHTCTATAIVLAQQKPSPLVLCQRKSSTRCEFCDTGKLSECKSACLVKN